MSKHLKHSEWVYWIRKYLSYNPKKMNLFWKKFYQFKGCKSFLWAKNHLKNKLKLYNMGMNLNSKTGRSLKKGKNVGQKPKKPRFNKNDITTIPQTELAWLLEEMMKIVTNDQKKKLCYDTRNFRNYKEKF